MAILAVSDLSPMVVGIATALDAAVPGGVALLDEARAEREVSETQSARELTTGVVQGDPWRLMAFAALAIVTIERAVLVVFALVYAASVAVIVGGDAVSLNDVVATTTFLSFPVAMPPLIVACLLLSRYVAHRVPRRPIVWVSGALVVALVIDVLLALVTLRVNEASVPAGTLAKLYAFLFIPLFVAVYFGVLWARRSRGRYLIARLFKRLRPDDQAVLIELAQGVTRSDP